MIGKTISHYKILEKLGGGGMGIVYKAKDTKLDRFVALKFLPPHISTDEEEKHRFIHEARAASGLDHPNICTVHEIDETRDGQLFIAMACYEGETLKQRISKGPLKIDEATDIAIQMIEGLRKAHEMDIVHRDIKPANIFLTRDGIVKILDFGLAKLEGRTKLTKSGTTLGTVAYMSPEQTRGETVDHRSDLWSVGIILYEMITGRLPFRGDYEQAITYSILNETPEEITGLRTGVPLELERIVNKALCKRTDERYQHTDELMADLRRLRRREKGDRVKTIETEGVERRQIRAGKNWLVLLPAAALVILGFLLISRFFQGRKYPREPIPVAVISFENQTGSAAYDYLMKAIPNLLITSLEQSKFLRVTTWERMRDLLRQMGKEAVEMIDTDTGIELCQREGVGAIVTGSFTKAGNHFATEIKVLDVETKGILAAAHSSGEGESSILRSQIDALSREIAKGIGLSAEALEIPDKSIADMTTRSMEAYSYFLLGREKYDNMDRLEALRLFERSIEYDSTFAVPYLYMARIYSALANIHKRNAMCIRAYKLSADATEKERMTIEAGYADLIEGDKSKQIAILERMIQRFPDEKQVHFDLGIVYSRQGMLDDADQMLREALRLDPRYGPAMNQLAYNAMAREKYKEALGHLASYTELAPHEPNPYDSMGDCYFRLGEIDSAAMMYKRALSHKPDFYSSGAKTGMIHILHQEFDEGLRAIHDAFFRVDLPAGGWRAFTGMIYFMLGRDKEAKTYFSEALETWDSIGADFFLITVRVSRGWNALERGKPDRVVKLAEEARESVQTLAPQWCVINWSHWALIQGEMDIALGRLDSAQKRIDILADSLDLVDGWHREMLEYERQLLKGNLMLARGAPDSTIALLAKLDLPAQPRLYSSYLGWYNLSTAYPSHRDALARAYIEKGDLPAAAEEYERLIRFNPKRQNLRFTHPKLHYRLARVYESMGETGKAESEYTWFLDLWKDADEGLTEIRDARARLAKLKGEG
jgi:tetratricopeptide (TPR) repeat protein